MYVSRVGGERDTRALGKQMSVAMWCCRMTRSNFSLAINTSSQTIHTGYSQ